MSSTRSSESALRSSWNEASIVTCSGSQPRRSTTMFLKSSKLSFWVSNLASSAKAHRGVPATYCSKVSLDGYLKVPGGLRRPHSRRQLTRRELAHHARQRALRPDLDENVAVHLNQRTHASGPAHRRAQLHFEHVRDAITSLMLASGEVGHYRHARRAPLDAIEGGAQPLGRRRHQWRVEGGAHVERDHALGAGLLQAPGRNLEPGGRTRDHRLGRRVV